MIFLAAGFAGNHFNGRLQIFHAAGDIGIARCAPRLAVILVVHGPAVKAIAGEFIHHGIFAMAGYIEVEHPRGHRRTMDEEQHRPRRLAWLGRAKPLAIHPQGNIAFPGPIFAAPDLAFGGCRGCVGCGYRKRSGDEAKSRAETRTKTRALEHRAPRQRRGKIRHGVPPVGLSEFDAASPMLSSLVATKLAEVPLCRKPQGAAPQEGLASTANTAGRRGPGSISASEAASPDNPASRAVAAGEN